MAGSVGEALMAEGKRIPGGEKGMSQLGQGLLLVGKAAGFRFLPGCQGFQR